MISDAHRGLQAPIRKAMQGSAWQRWCVHLLRNVLAHVPGGQAEMGAASLTRRDAVDLTLPVLQTDAARTAGVTELSLADLQGG